MMGTIASQTTCVSIVCSTYCSGADERKHQSSTSLALVREIHWWPVNSLHKESVTRKLFPFDDAILINLHAITVDIYLRISNLDDILYMYKHFSTLSDTFMSLRIFGQLCSSFPFCLTNFRIDSN